MPYSHFPPNKTPICVLDFPRPSLLLTNSEGRNRASTSPSKHHTYIALKQF